MLNAVPKPASYTSLVSPVKVVRSPKVTSWLMVVGADVGADVGTTGTAVGAAVGVLTGVLGAA